MKNNNTHDWEKVTTHKPSNRLKMITPSGKMRRSLVAQFARPIVYYPVLSKYGFTSNTTSNILMIQLEYRFDKMLDKGQYYFYKFIEPAKKTYGYRLGDSWCEELAITPAQFRKAFDDIGVAHKSKSTFDKIYEKDPQLIFQKKVSSKVAKKNKSGKISKWIESFETKEMFYASYHDRMRHRIYFFRNDSAVDNAIATIAIADPTEVNQYKKKQRDNENRTKIKKQKNTNSYLRVNSTSVSSDKPYICELDYQKSTLQKSTNGNKVNKGIFDKNSIYKNNDEINFKELNQDEPIVSSRPKSSTGESRGIRAARNARMIKHFFKRYEELRGEAHPRLSQAHRDSVCRQLEEWIEDFGTFEVVVENYFNTLFKNCDYRIMHFVQDKILENRIFESAY